MNRGFADINLPANDFSNFHLLLFPVHCLEHIWRIREKTVSFLSLVCGHGLRSNPLRKSSLRVVDARICPSIEAQFLRIQCKPSEPLIDASERSLAADLKEYISDQFDFC